MIPNLINTVTGLVLAYVVVLEPTWIERQYLPMAVFAVIILLMALWARRSDANHWFSDVNIVLAIALGVLSVLPLETLPDLAFWGGFWISCLVPTIAFWAALYRPKPAPAEAAHTATPTIRPAPEHNS